MVEIRTCDYGENPSARISANSGAILGNPRQWTRSPPKCFGIEKVKSDQLVSGDFVARDCLTPPECLERVMGIEPTLAAWEAAVLPLNYTRAPRVGLYERRRPGGNPRSSGRGGAGEDPCGCPNAAQAGAARRASAARRTAASRSARTASKRLLAAATISGRARSGRPESNGGAGAYSIASCTLSA